MPSESPATTGIASRADWRVPASYNALIGLDRAGWAWEWLRRNPDFIAELERAPHPARRLSDLDNHPGFATAKPPVFAASGTRTLKRWGCCFATNRDLPGPGASVFWHTDCNPSVLVVEARPISPGHADAFDVRRFRQLVRMLNEADGTEHLLFTDGQRHLQLAVIGGSVLHGPVSFRYKLSGFRQTEAKVLALRRLLLLCRLGHLPNGLFTPQPRASRWAMMLRAFDGAQAGASQREIAAALFGEKAVREDWGGRSDYLRTRVQRLIREAEKLVSGGYRDLLK